ncbi:MAG: DUF2332 domain-containing protein, partial [Sphingomonadaceae bacterium]|nr:DUF2332 domain-containing protein [Sphingomonadaceae bacterium]
RAVAATLVAHDEALLPWLDGPPQTNEPGRSSSFVAGMLWLARRLPARFEVLEIGSSAGLNLMLDRYRYEFPGVSVGPEDAPIRLAPEWRGPPPPAGSIAFESMRGVDIAPVDLADPAQAARLSAYIWHEHEVRFGRFERAITMVRERPPALERGDAADWIEARLAEPQREGVTRLLVHSIVWQYLGEARQARIVAAMEEAGAQATAECPLAWLALEANRVDFKHELVARYWPGGGEPVMLGRSHAHGAWLEWRGVG